MTIDQTLTLATKQLKNKQTIPRFEAEILLAGVLKKPLEFLLSHGEKKLSRLQAAKYKLCQKRRLKGEPIAYLIGHKEFYGLDFMVNRNVLIPRPETELIIEETLKLIHGADRSKAQPITIIDVGTGSGCIIITLAEKLSSESRIMNYNFVATDISPQALSVAKKNASAHHVNKKIKFIKGDLLAPLIQDSSFIIPNSQLVILANLPYGWPAWKNNSSLDTIGLKFEPQIALFAKKDGLELYEKLFQQIKLLPMSCQVLCEFDPRQTIMIKKLVKKYLPQAKIQIKKDLCGLNRLLAVNLTG